MAAYVDQDAILADDVVHGAMWKGNAKQTTMTRTWIVQVKQQFSGKGTLPNARTAAYRATQVQCGIGNAGPALYGDPHPDYPALTCTDIASETLGESCPNQFRVTCTYTCTSDYSNQKPTHGGKSTIEFSTVSTNVRTTVDNFGNPMLMEFVDPTQNYTTRTQPFEAEVSVPMPVITFRRREPLTGLDYVLLKLQYEGRLNSVLIWGGAPHTWLCTGIHATLGADAYDVTYSFQYHGHFYPFSWDPVGFFREKDQVGDVAAGAPAEGISIANGGIQQFTTVYAVNDFSNLGLSYTF